MCLAIFKRDEVDMEVYAANAEILILNDAVMMHLI